jgi:hypothetical protein
MNKLKSLLLALSVVLVSQAAAKGQELDRLADRIKGVVEAAEPDWKCKRGSVFATPNETPNLLLEVCSLHAQLVRRHEPIRDVIVRHVTIHATPFESEEKARQAFHLNMSNTYQPLKDLGDEAYGWGMDHADIVIRKGRFILFISTVVHVDYDPDAISLSREEKNARVSSERLKLTPQFVKHALAALD